MRKARMKPISHCHHQHGHPQMDGRGRSGSSVNTLYWRQGEALDQGGNDVHMLLEEDWKNNGDRKAWVMKEYLTKVGG